MTNQEVLDKIDAAFDITLLRGDFPNVERVITQLDDGSQEIIYRMQGADPDFYPADDLVAIDAITMKDIPCAIKNTISEKRYKEQAKEVCKQKLLFAIYKRIKSMISMAGIPVKQLHTFIGLQLPVVEEEI